MADDLDEIAKWMRDAAERSHSSGYGHFRSGAILAILDDRATLAACLAEAEKETAAYRRAYGCLACGEDHGPDTMCPPHEVRTTGLAWYDARMRKAVADTTEASAKLAEAEAQRDDAREERDATIRAVAAEGRLRGVAEARCESLAGLLRRAGEVLGRVKAFRESAYTDKDDFDCAEATVVYEMEALATDLRKTGEGA